jgi:Flp pilus assembly protein CpaB
VDQIHGTMRAVQVAFNANRVIGGTLKAGDHVDIYSVFTIQPTLTNSKYSAETVSGMTIRNVEVLSTYDTGVAGTQLTSASGANSASGTNDGTGGDAVILAVPQNEVPTLMLTRKAGEFWVALLPSHGAQDAISTLANPCSIWGLTAAQIKHILPVCIG